MIKTINGKEVDDFFLYPKAYRYEWDKGQSWKKLETTDTYPDYIINHFTCSYKLEDTVGYFQNEGVSVHFVVGKKGEVVQMVPCDRRAAHAGSSEWDGNHDGKITNAENDLNRFSIGIEVVCLGPLDKRGNKFYDCWDREYKGPVRDKYEIGFQYWEPFTPEQEQAVKEICEWACKQFGINPLNVADHAEVAPKRKNDAGASSEMTGDEFRAYLKTRLSSNPPPYSTPSYKVHVISEMRALNLLNYLKQETVANEDLIVGSYSGACAFTGCTNKPASGNVICEDCHKNKAARIIVKS